jgi:hypothetical protein
LQTYDEGNSRGSAGDGGAVRSVLGDGEDGLRRCSSFEEQLYSFALFAQSPPGSIASNVDESSSCDGYLCALGFGACGTKFDE